jgi:hypothetical protein
MANLVNRHFSDGVNPQRTLNKADALLPWVDLEDVKKLAIVRVEPE